MQDQDVITKEFYGDAARVRTLEWPQMLERYAESGRFS